MSAAGGEESVEEYEEVDALEDSDDDFAYEEVDVEDIEDDDLLAGDDEDLETAMRSLQGLGVPLVGANTTMKPEPNAGEVTKRPEVRAGSGMSVHRPPVPDLDRDKWRTTRKNHFSCVHRSSRDSPNRFPPSASITSSHSPQSPPGRSPGPPSLASPIWTPRAA